MKTEYVFNPLTGEFDLVRKGNDGGSSGYEVCIGTTISATRDGTISDNMKCTIYRGSFSYEIGQDGEHLVIAIPAEYPAPVISSNGFVIPMEAPFLSGDKNMYVSSAGLKKGLIENILIKINQ